MSLAALRDMQFTELTDEEALAASGEGNKLSRAQCALLYANSLNPNPCGGSMTDYYKIWKQAGCAKYGK